MGIIIHIPHTYTYLPFPSQIPRNYIHLHQHIAKHHPSLLESFEQGWNNLSPHLQAKFHDPITNRLPAYFHGIPPRAIRFPIENTHGRKLEEWISWTSFACDELGTPHLWGDLYNFSRTGYHDFEQMEYRYIYKILVEKMDHESSVFGLPPIPIESETPPDRNTQIESKRRVVMKVIVGCLERVRIEAAFRMEQRLEKEGLEGFKSILNGESIIDELAKADASCHSSGE